MDGRRIPFKILLAFGIVFKSWGSEMCEEKGCIFEILMYWFGELDEEICSIGWVERMSKSREEDHQGIHKVPLSEDSPNPFHPVLKHGSRSVSDQ